MPARIASGTEGQASMRAARPGSMAGVSGVSAPDFAPPCPKSTVFVEICEEVRIPPSPLYRQIGPDLSADFCCACVISSFLIKRQDRQFVGFSCRMLSDFLS